MYKILKEDNMEIYNYHPATGEFLGSATADKSPLEPGVFLIPAYATTVAPPTPSKNQIPIFLGGKWVMHNDYRGKTYYETDTGERHDIINIGESPNPSWTEKVPKENSKWNGSEWVADVEAVKEISWRKLEADLHNYIFSVHDYPIPTQTTLISIFGDPESNESQRNECKKIFDWIKTIVLPYYYSKKKEILESETPDLIRWDFNGACGEYAPRTTLYHIFTLGGE